VALLTKEALLGASDLVEREVELPSIGGSVKVRSLPAAYANEAVSQAVKMVKGPRGEETSTIDHGHLESLMVFHGLVEPKMASVDEVRTFAQQCGPAFREVIRVINEISGVDEESVEKTAASFPPSGPGPGGPDVGAVASNGSGGPDLSVRAGA
jgi:hypothetical protein